jgi:ATP-dependent Clp protease adaptor protein ClpS
MPEAPVAEPEQATDTARADAPRWKVLLHDDEVTTIDFVVWLLMRVFAKPPEEAVELTLLVHRTGLAIVAITHLERAELYVEQVRSLARPRGFPLTATIEKA